MRTGRHTDKHIYILIDIQADRHRHIDRQPDTQTDTYIYTPHTDRHTHQQTHTDRHTHIYTDRQTYTCTQTDRHTHTHRQTDRHTDRHTYINK